MKTIKIFKPHMEIRIHVTDEMQKEYDECEILASETSKGKDCNTCSWNECKIGDVGACQMYEEYLKKEVES